MREFKIFLVVAAFSLLIYIGVEPFAHSQMHKHIQSKNFTYPSLPSIKKGDIQKGQELVMANCIGCHSLNVEGMPAPLDAVTSSASYGVNPPDLSNAGAIFDGKYLAAFIADPVKASHLEHRYEQGSEKAYPMPGYSWMPKEDIEAMVSYLQSIAKEDITPKEAFVDACGRCHAVRYDNKVAGEKWTQIGQKPKFKHEKDSLAFDIKTLEYEENLAKYMGALPPDLSMIIRARSNNFLETFIENPQTQLEGSSMPAVGLNKLGFTKVMEYLQSVGDPSKPTRESMGVWFLIYMGIFTILAILWKKSVWKKLK